MDTGRLVSYLFPNTHIEHQHYATTAFEFFLPSQALQNNEESALFMKKLVTVAVSNMFRSRGVFQENEFVNYGNLDYDANVLNETKVTGYQNVSQANYVVDRLFGLFDAIDRTYVKEWYIRLLSQGDGNENDCAEQFKFTFTYDETPLITLTNDGAPENPQELERESFQLLDSVSTLMGAVENICTTMPRLTVRSNPKLTIWMRKTSWAPREYIAPSYRLPLYPPIRPIPVDSIVYSTSTDPISVTTGRHATSIVHQFAAGNFADSDLFKRYYNNRRGFS